MKTTTSLHKALLIALILTTASITGNSQPLVQAALSGDASRVKQLLAEGADINQTNSRGNTALGVAVLFQYKPVVDVLLAEGADVNFTRNESSTTVLAFAAIKDNVEVLKSLIKHGARLNDANSWGQTPIISAALSGKSENVKILQAAGASFTNDLVYSSALGQMESVKQFLRDKSDINATNQIGWTPLAAAAANNQEAIVKLLLDKGADANSAGMEGDFRETALILASENGHAEVVNLLLAKKADLKIAVFDTVAKRSNGETALSAAVSAGHAEVVKALLDYGVDPNGPDASGVPVLFIAADKHTAIAKMLLDKGANINAEITQGRGKGATALIDATIYGNAESVQLLLSRGARVSAKTLEGSEWMTALRVAQVLQEQERSPEKVRLREQIVQMLSNPDAAVTNLAELKSTTVVDSTKMTKAEWRKKVRPYWNPGGGIKVTTVANFKALVGEPSRTQTIELNTLWYFDCSDGTIQVDLTDPNATGGQMCINSINDY